MVVIGFLPLKPGFKVDLCPLMTKPKQIFKIMAYTNTYRSASTVKHFKYAIKQVCLKLDTKS